MNEKIEKIELFKVPPRWLFLKITTASGLYGWGEPVIEGKAETVKAAVEEMSEYLIGKDAFRIEDIWQTLYRGSFYRGGPILTSAISGIDQALWDIKGKALGVPIYELLGGAVREKMQVYSWIGGDKPSDLVQNAKRKMQDGFTALKMNATEKLNWICTPSEIKSAVDRFAVLREAVGWDINIGIDFHGRVHKGVAKVLMKQLEPYMPFFIEEPVLTEHYEILPVLQQQTSIPIAIGERNYTRWEFKHLLATGAVDILQADLSHAGGISEVRRIAAMAEAYDVTLAPHCPLGPIALSASLQLDMATPNVLIQETSLGMHYNNGSLQLTDYVKNPEVFKCKKGYIERNNIPGLGIEVDEDKVKEMSAKEHNWRNPIWRNADGSVTEW